MVECSAVAARRAAFAPSVAREAERLYREVQTAWDARDLDRLAARRPDLIEESAPRLATSSEGGTKRVSYRRAPVEYVGLVNARPTRRPRGVRIGCALRDYVSAERRAHQADGGRTRRAAPRRIALNKREAPAAERSSGTRGRHNLARIVATQGRHDAAADDAVAERAAPTRRPGLRARRAGRTRFDGNRPAPRARPRSSPRALDPERSKSPCARAVEAWAARRRRRRAAARARAARGGEALRHPGTRRARHG